MTKPEELKKRILEEPDFIHCSKMGNSIKQLRKVYDEGVSDSYIAKVLLLTEEEVVAIYNNFIKKAQKSLEE
jgi:hypothetical protein